MAFKGDAKAFERTYAFLSSILPYCNADWEKRSIILNRHLPETELDRLSNIINQFNDLFGDIEWEDEDRVHELNTETIPARVAEDKAYRNAQRNSDGENAKIEHERALGQVMISVLNDDTTLYRHFVQTPGFKRWLTDLDFELSSERVEGRVE